MLAAHWPREEQLTLVSGAAARPTPLTLCTVWKESLPHQTLLQLPSLAEVKLVQPPPVPLTSHHPERQSNSVLATLNL